jgi:hypothetical protein
MKLKLLLIVSALQIFGSLAAPAQAPSKRFTCKNQSTHHLF